MTEKPYLTFSKSDAHQAVLTKWWSELSKGDRAELKRCSSLEEVALLGAYHRLRFGLLPLAVVDPVRLAVVTGLASHVKVNNQAMRIAQQMGMKKAGGDAPVMSELRFRRLLAIDELPELYRTMIRIVRILGGEVNLISLADSAYHWNIRTKKEFASDYFEKVSAYTK